ncbi:Ubiquitin-associated and SH3 domain-containing protein A [Trichinella zimbabwensis]|uniref:Ubiquitin-associated and SH3 domain-containing protein A n=1 Tax=Trichinella zimbabwensis TaxID=268475 RepID=A0A0V1HZ51_9BILA|nr:Ubiquitin-associated and SH3 domain-containing protein A [Trichinella zimbabwensis]
MVQKILTLRHFESIEDVFGKKWRSLFDKDGYRLEEEKDANLPDQVSLVRKAGTTDKFESPLSCIGQIFARLGSRRFCELSILKQRYVGQAVYSCPCMACLQTSCAMLKTLLLANVRKIRVEPGLADFRCTFDSTDSKAEEIRKVFGLDTKYQPVISKESLKANETMDNFRERHKLVMDSIIANQSTSTAIIVTHSANVVAHMHYFSKEPLDEATFKDKMKFGNSVIFAKKRNDIWKWKTVKQLKLSNPKNDKFPIHLWD